MLQPCVIEKIIYARCSIAVNLASSIFKGFIMKKALTAATVFVSSSMVGLGSVLAADYPPNGDTTGGVLPETGANIFGGPLLLDGPVLYAGIALLLGMGILGSQAVRRRSTSK